MLVFSDTKKPASSTQSLSNTSRKLVYCEPNLLVQEAFSLLFARQFSFQILALACTAEEALSALDKHNPSLFISEINLSDKSGIEVLLELSRRGKQVNSLLLTGIENTKDRSSL